MMMMPSIDLVRTGENIKMLREKMGVSVKALQGYFGFSSPQAIYKWQQGHCLPTVDNLIILSRIFHTTIEEILVLKESQGTFVFRTFSAYSQ